MSNLLKKISALFIILSISGMFLIPLSASAKEPIFETPADSTLIVGVGQTYTTIQDAINAATSGDIIRVWEGTYNENVLINKTLTLIGNNSNTIINGCLNPLDTVLITANYVNISNFIIEGNESDIYSGIQLNNVQNCNISNNTIRYNYYGVFCNYSNNNNINNNNICDFYIGIMLIHSNNSILFNNNNTYGNYGTTFLYSYNNTIYNNNLSYNDYGVCFLDSSFNIINNNTISYNIYGVYVFNIGLGSTNNQFYYNNFIDNTNQAVDENINQWDNGYPSGGNYWSDYTGIDENSDGIGDWSYNFTTGQDNYPYIFLIGSTPPTTPTVIYTYPELLNGNVSTYITNVIIDFSENMNITVGNITTNLPNATFEWTNSSSITITCIILEYHTDYYVNLTNFISEHDIEMVDYNLTFTTVAPIGEIITDILISVLPIVIIIFAVVMIVTFINNRKKE